MIDPKMQHAINEQINAELHSAYLYQAMAAYFEEQSLLGMANWMQVQMQEELIHVGKFYKHLIDRGGHVKLLPVKEVPDRFDSITAVFEASLSHEQYITRRIYDLVDLAAELKDHAVKPLLNWFIDEQVEEEANAEKNLQQIKLMGGQGQGLFMLDRELAARPAPFTLNMAVAAT